LEQLVLVLLGHDVGPQALREARQRVRHGLDAGCLGRIELPDEIDDLRKAVLVDGDFGVGE
jgi:hypothetical protein